MCLTLQWVRIIYIPRSIFRIIILYFSHADYFIQFGKGLGRESQELEKVWDGVLGRYDRGVQRLVVDALLESQNPVEKLVYAVRQMKTPESAQRAAQAVQNGKYKITR